MDWICSRCGKLILKREDYYSGLCIDCYKEAYTPSQIPNFLDIIICPHCLRYKVKERWVTSKLTDFSNIILEAAGNYVNKTLSHDKNIVEVKLIPRLESEDEWGAKSQIPVSVMVKHKINEGKHIIVQHSFILNLHSNICPDCAKSHRGAYQAIIQIRAKNRQISEEEQGQILNFIQDLIRKTHTGLPEHALTKIKQTHKGLDLYFSSNSAAKKISTIIVTEFGCSHKSSEKIAGRDKSGRTQFKIVYSLRLPDFRPGDIIEWNGKNYLLDNISGGKARIIDISTDQKTTIPLSEAWRIKSIIKKESFMKFLIIAIEDNTVDLMNSKTYEVYAINKPSWTIKTGMEVYGFISKNGVISLIPQLK